MDINIGHYDFIDCLRGFAVLGVIAVHAGEYGTTNWNSTVGKIIFNAQMGVQMFYLASALTLFLSLHNRFQKEERPFRNFFIRRFFRIAPMFYLAIIAYTFVGNWYPGITIGNIIAHFTFINGFQASWINTCVPGGWSVGVETEFYVVLPFLFLYIKDLNQSISLFTLSMVLRPVVVKLLSRAITLPDEYGYFWYQFLLNQFPVFCLGIVLYFMIFDKKDKCISDVNILLLSLCILVELFTGKKNFLAGQVVFTVGFLFFAYAIRQGNLKIFVNPLFKYLGKVSYSMYLIHFAVFAGLQKAGFADNTANIVLNYCIRYVFGTLITVGIATISYNIIEHPFQKLGKLIILKLETK